MEALVKAVLLAGTIILSSILSYGQAADEAGVRPFTTLQGGPVEDINLSNHTLNLHPTLLSYPQRGGKLEFNLIVHYTNATWQQKEICPPGSLCQWLWFPDSGGSAKINVIRSRGVPFFFTQNLNTSTTPPQAYFVKLSDGSTHPAGQIGANLYETLDSTGILLNTSTSDITWPDGVRANANNFIMSDPNVNQITQTSSGWVDTMGRNIPGPPGTNGNIASGGVTTSDFSHCTGQLPIDSAALWTVPGPNGGLSTYKFCFVKVHVFTHHWATDDATHSEVNNDEVEIQSIVLPDNSAWTFDYSQPDANGINWGDLVKITYPTGGSISYVWQTSHGCSVSHTFTDASYRAVTQRTIDANDGSGPQVWTYSGSTVTDPLGNDTVHTFTNLSGCSFYETETQSYKGSHGAGSVIQTVTTQYSFDLNPNTPSTSPATPPTAINVVAKVRTTTLANGLVKQTSYVYDPGFPYTSAFGAAESGLYGKVTSQIETDWGQGSAGQPLRETDTQYQFLTDSSGAYKAANLLETPNSVIVKDGGNNVVAKTTLGYDEIFNNISVQPSGITTQHAGVTGVRGNRTSTTKWLLSSNTPVTAHLIPYDTGEPYQAFDPNSNATTYSYDSAYAGALQTMTCRPNTGTVTHCISGTYDFNTGHLTSFTDENGSSQASGNTQGDPAHTTVYVYNDPLGRLTSITSPADSSGTQPQTTFNYSDAGVLPVSVEQLRTIVGTTKDDSTTYLDGLGRKFKTVHNSAGNATVITKYDPLGRVGGVTNPYIATNDATYGVTSYSYDPLGRITATTKQDRSISTMDYSGGNCVIGMDEAGTALRRCSDALGRIVEVDEPQSNSVGANAAASVTISGSLSSSPSSADPAPIPGPGTPLTSIVLSDGTPHVFFVGTDQHIYHLSWTSTAGWANQDITTAAGGTLVGTGSGLNAFLNSGGCPHVFYIDPNQHVSDLFMNNVTGGCASTWSYNDYTSITGNILAAAGSPLASAGAVSDGYAHIFYLGANRHIYRIYWPKTGGLVNQDLTAAAAAPTVVGTGSPLNSFVNAGGCPHVFYIDPNQHVSDLFMSNVTGGCATAWGYNDYTSLTGNTLSAAASPITSVGVAGDGNAHIIYLGTNQHVYRIYWPKSGGLLNQDLTAAAAGSPQASTGTGLESIVNSGGCPHIRYVATNQHVNDLFLGNISGGCSSTWSIQDLSAMTGNTLASSTSPLTSVGVAGDGLQHVFYLTGVSHLDRLYWNTSGTLLNQDLTTTVTASGTDDSGTVSLDVGSSTATACFGKSSNSACAGQPINVTSSDIAAALVQALNSPASPVTATASGSSINMVWKTPGVMVAVDALTTVDDNPTLFPNPSFTSQATAFSGGIGASLNNPNVTLYSYDALGNLLCVEQHGNATGSGCSAPPSSDATSPWRVRRFTYDSLSRLLTAKNPESGTITYSYDADGNVLQKTSPAPNQPSGSTLTQTISYCYDALNRVTGKAYSAQACQNGQLPTGTAAATYTYDQGTNGIGQRTAMTDASGSSSWSYDALGRMLAWHRAIGTFTETIGYSYNLDNSLAGITYPSGAVISYAPDAAGRPVSAVDTGSNINYVTSAGYDAASLPTGFISGASATFSGINNTFTYNARLQPITIAAALSPSQTLLSLTYDFHEYKGNNGNVWGVTNNKDATRSLAYAYDQLNRLTSAQNSGTDCTKTTVNPTQTEYWGNTYTYDAWGNLIGKSVSKCSAENLSTGALVNNQLSSYSYDAAGSMVSDPSDGVTLVYDAENRIASATKSGVTTTYTYDGDGNRVKKSGGSAGTLYWYGLPGILAESDLSGTIKSEYVFFNGQRVARRDEVAPTGVYYYFSDFLKSTALITDAAGTIKSESDFYPWGGELPMTSSDSNHYKFTGKERDGETNIDYFGARFYSAALGRFMTPDWSEKPVTVPYADLSDPQTLNLYSYVRNSPVARFDADGHFRTSASNAAEEPCPDGTNDCNEEQVTFYNETRIAWNDKNNTATLTQTSTTKTVNADGTVTYNMTTTTAVYSTAAKHEGEFITGSVQRESFKISCDCIMAERIDRSNFHDPNDFGPRSITAGAALKAFGIDAIGYATTPHVGWHDKGLFANTISKDMKEHPFKYAGYVFGAAAIPVGGVSVIGGAILSSLGIGSAIVDDATH
jgi:RHS repeat-associated protein